MPSINATKVRKNLIKKGFAENEGGNHIRYDFYYDNKKILMTIMSRNNQDINNYLQAQMAKQIKLNNKQFYDLATCKIDKDDYIKILKEQSII